MPEQMCCSPARESGLLHLSGQSTRGTADMEMNYALEDEEVEGLCIDLPDATDPEKVVISYDE